MDTKPKLDTDEPTLREVLKETALLPPRLLLSRGALKTYFSTILLGLSALIFYLVAASTYIYFYYNYIPNLSFTIPVHLQYADSIHNWPHAHPHAITTLATSGSSASSLVSQQKYDFTVQLTLPRSKENIQAGNFMINMSLLGPTTRGNMPTYLSPAEAEDLPDLAQSSRSATLTYTSALVETTRKAIALPFFVTGWKKETETLKVPLMEGIAFERGWRNIPKAVRLHVISRERLQIYACEMHIIAKLGGIRWVMYHHKVASFMLFTGIFWSVEMATALTIWAFASLILPFATSKAREKTAIEQAPEKPPRPFKQETDEDKSGLSDTSRSFPTFYGQPPLRYSGSSLKDPASIKQEEVEVAPDEIIGQTRMGEADVSATDSDEDADFVLQEPESIWTRKDSDFRDSGLGTSWESTSGSGSGSGDRLARRRSGGRREK